MAKKILKALNASGMKMEAYKKKRTSGYRKYMPFHNRSIADPITSYFKSRLEVVAVYFSGSYVQGREKTFSDNDLGVLLDHKAFIGRNDSGD
ncbi:hypothetical protein LCGC14_2948100 [marine sediment metagenome]|uniref:Polymerase beta nucleotidyltransferase domain-containing protein n=1 Tax=marine sediment metagenome TaxID=412755 RepID=A0A0F8ZNS4_9ZZZZ